MKSKVFQSGVLQDLLVEVDYRVWVVHFPGEGRGEQVVAVWMFWSSSSTRRL